MYEIKEIYEEYQKAKAKKKNKEYRLSKNFEQRFMEVMSSDSQYALIEVTDKFNGEWNMVEPYNYFLIGFKSFKSFTYKDILHPDIIKKYIKNEVKKRKKKNQCVNTFFDVKETLIEEVISVPEEKVKTYDYMEDIRDVYVAYRKAQAEVKERGYRIPKDFDKWFNTKLNSKNRDNLATITKYFLTKWSNVNPYEYFKCGFTLLKSFTYTQFFDERILQLYIINDKNKKRDMSVITDEMENSKRFINAFMKSNGITSLKEYCSMRISEEPVVIRHYIENKIDKFILVKLISKGILKLSDSDRAKIPYIVDQYREILEKLEEIK